MKEGLIFEQGELRYYKKGYLYHAGIVKDKDGIYYIDSHGRAVKGQHTVHEVMTNGIIKKGTYTFGEDYKLIKGSYIAPKKNKKKGKSSFKKLLKGSSKKTSKKKQLIQAVAVAAFLTAFLVVGVLLLCAENETILPGWKDQQVAQQQERALPKFDKEVLLCSEGAKQEFDGKRSLEAAVKDGVPYRPFRFDYTLETPAKMLLSEREDFRDGKTYDLEAGTNTLYIDNLKTGKTYHYKIVTDSEEFLGFFHTASSTRFVSMPGVSHTRDIGGRENLAGKTVKQGLLIRGTELDGLVNTSFFLQEEAVEGMQADFGFVYEMDLRSATVYNGPYRSVLGEQVGHQFYDAPMYGDIFNQSRAASLQAIFADLAKPENYPMYLHCTHGTDRTGTIVFLLQGVLGMSEEDMLREYRLNSYENPNILSSTSMDVVIRGLQPYEGDTLAEKTVSFLTETVGVTEAQIASIRTIFLGEE